MAYYLVQASYTPEAWATFVQSPEDRRDAIKPVIEKLGGSMHGLWLAFGEYDALAIVELPDNVSAAAFSMAAAARGAIKSFKTTPLMTVEEGMEAMRKAGDAGYRPPGN